MDITQFSAVVALVNTSIISISTHLELWGLSNSVSEASFTFKRMRWHQLPAPSPPLPRAPLNYWPDTINALSTIHFINTTTCILEGDKYLLLHTVLYTVLHNLVYTVLYMVLHIVLYPILHIIRCTILYTAMYTALNIVLPIVLSSVSYTVSLTLFVLVIERQNK